MGLTSDELATMRADSETFLDQTGAILEPTEGTSSIGGRTQSWGTVASSVAMALYASGGQERLSANRLEFHRRYDLYLPSSQSLREDYRVVIGGRTFDVEWVDVASTRMTTKRAIVRLKGNEL